MKQAPHSSGLLLVLAWLLCSTPVYAGGAIQVDINGNPLLWDSSQPLIYNPENGALKSEGAFDVEATFKLLDEAFSTWANLPGSKLRVLQGNTLNDQGFPDGVNASNYQDFLGTGTEECYPGFFPDTQGNCQSPIIFDEDGEIIDALFGTCAKFSILGFAGFDDIDDDSGDPARRIVRRGQALFSGACLDPAVSKAGCGVCNRPLSDDEMRTIVLHEVGHLMGMDHSQVNPEAFSQCNSDLEGCPAEVSEALPTMFPILVNGAQMLSLHRDDEAYFTRLYGTVGNDGCVVSGKIFASDGVTEVRGVEVVAVNTDTEMDLIDRISFVSGAESPKLNGFSRRQGNCASDCGAYSITGLTPGEDYQLCVQRISSQFTGGSSIEPVDPPFQLFTNQCPEGLVVSCVCETLPCETISGVDIVTDTDPADVGQGDEEVDNFEVVSPSSGGCSLIKPAPRPTGTWKRITKSLLQGPVPFR